LSTDPSADPSWHSVGNADEFLHMKMREIFSETVAALQADPDAWLVHDNADPRIRPHDNPAR